MKQLYIFLLAFLALSLPLLANGQLPDTERELMGIKGPVRAFETFFTDDSDILYEFDRAGHLLQVTEEYRYDEDYLVWTARVEHDADGRPSKIWLEAPQQGPYLLRSFEYHEEGQIAKIVYYPLGSTTYQVSIYGDNGQVATYQEWFDEENMQYYSQIFYDEEGRRIYEEEYHGPAEVDYFKIHYTYTEQGYPLTKSKLNYWDEPNYTEEYQLDENGQVVGRTLTFGDGDKYQATYWLDKYGNTVEVVGDYASSNLYHYFED